MRLPALTGIALLLAACSSGPPACNSPEVLATMERLHTEQWNEYVRAQRDTVVAAKLTGVLGVAFAASGGSIVDYAAIARTTSDTVVYDSTRRALEKEFDSAVPKMTLAYSGTMTVGEPSKAESSCKAQVDISTNGEKQITKMISYLARYTDDKKVFVEAEKLVFEKE
jgi:hypothetical protein